MDLLSQGICTFARCCQIPFHQCYGYLNSHQQWKSSEYRVLNNVWGAEWGCDGLPAWCCCFLSNRKQSSGNIKGGWCELVWWSKRDTFRTTEETKHQVRQDPSVLWRVQPWCCSLSFCQHFSADWNSGPWASSKTTDTGVYTNLCGAGKAHGPESQKVEGGGYLGIYKGMQKDMKLRNVNKYKLRGRRAWGSINNRCHEPGKWGGEGDWRLG